MPTSDFSKYPLFSLTIDDGVTAKTDRYERGFLVKKEGDTFKVVNDADFVMNPMNLRFGAIGCNNEGYPVSVSGYYDVFRIEDGKYNYFWLSYFRTPSAIKKYDTVATGSLIEKRRVHFSEFKKLQFAIPSNNEKRRITDFLSALDKRIEKQRRLVDTLKSYKRGLIRTLLTPDRNRRDGVEWTSITIGELGKFVKGAPLSKADISAEGDPFVLYGELYTTYGEVITSVIRKTNAKVDPVYYSKVGDVVIPTSGETPEEISTASCVMLPNIILAGDLNIFRTSLVDGRILSYILNHIANWQIARIAQGKSVVHIQASELARIEIMIPDSKEQSRIVSVVGGLDRIVSNNEATLEKLVMVKSALLQQLFV